MRKNQLQAYKIINNVTLSGEDDEAFKFNQWIRSTLRGETEKEDKPPPGNVHIEELGLRKIADGQILATIAAPVSEKPKAIINININNNIATGIRGSPR